MERTDAGKNFAANFTNSTSSIIFSTTHGGWGPLRSRASWNLASCTPLWERRCLFHHRGYWMLVHAHSPELLAAIACGNAFLTRLEGEWCMRFHAGTHPLEHHLEAALPHHESIRIAR